MQGGHLEDAPPRAGLLFGVLEVEDLQHDRQRLDEEDAAEDGYQQFFADDDGEDGDDAAEGQAARVAHEDLRGIGVVPQEADRGADKGRGEDHQLLGAGDEHDVEERGKLEVRRGVGQHPKRDADNGRAARRQSVESVGEVRAVRDGGDDEDGHQHKEQPGDFRLVATGPSGQHGVVEVVVLDKGDGRLGGLHFAGVDTHLLDRVLPRTTDLHVFADHDVRTEIERQADNQPEAHLGDDLEAPVQPLLVFLEDLDIVVCKAQCAQPDGGDEHKDQVDVVQPGEEEQGDDDGDDDDDAAHRGCAFLAQLTLKAQLADGFADLKAAQAVDDASTDGRGDEEGQDEGHHGAEGDVFEDACTGDVQLIQVVE